MIRFLDGPMKGCQWDVHTAPKLVRCVRDIDTDKPDVLNEREDVPTDREAVVGVYRIVAGTWGQVFIDFRGKHRAQSGRYESGDYVWMRHADGEKLRDRETWVEWAMGLFEAHPEAAEDTAALADAGTGDVPEPWGNLTPEAMQAAAR